MKTRIVLEVDSKGADILPEKELVAMALEMFGSVRVISVERKEQK